VLDLARGRLLVDIEVKAPGLEAALADLVRATAMSGQILVTSFHDEPLRRVGALAPELPLGLLQVSPDPAAAVRLRAPVYLPAVGTLTPALVETSRRLGLRVIPWTVRSEAEIRRATALRVDGFIADDPALARRLLGG